MNVLKICILICFMITIASCTTIFYYDFENAAIRFPISKGYIAYELVSLEQDLLFCKDSDYEKLVLTDPYFKANKEMLDYLRNTDLDKNNTYYWLTILYDINENYRYLETIKRTPDVKILVDSIYVNFIDTSESYSLTEYFTKYFVLDGYGDPLTKAITILPIKIPKANNSEFKIQLILTILNEDGSLLDKRHLNLNVERKKKTNTFLTPCP